MEKILNKTMDFQDLLSTEAKAVAYELNSLIIDLRSRQLKISSWYGKFDIIGDPLNKINRGYNYQPLPDAADDINFPWFLYWEIIWVYLNADFKPGQKVIDFGGSSSLFSYFLASKGFRVVTIDLQEDLVVNADSVAKSMGWDMQNYVMDITKAKFDEEFDHITSLCVYEHIPFYERVKINKKINEFLKEGGKFSITFDYRNPSKFARISSPQDVYEQFVQPSGLKIRGNHEFIDNEKNYLLNPFYSKKFLLEKKIKGVLKRRFSPLDFFKTKDKNDYTFAALFLEK